MAKLFIVEDDATLKEELMIFFEKQQYHCVSSDVYTNIVETILAENVDLLILDLNLPKTDGFYICREIRKHSTIPILILTSQNTEMNELMSLNIGADDFVAKPFHPQILLARVALLIRKGSKSGGGDSIRYRDLQLSMAHFEVVGPLGTCVLTKNEVAILKMLLDHRNSIVSRDQLMHHLWNSNEFIDDNTLTVNVTRLRQKLKQLTLDEIIQTRRGVGYIIYD